MERGLVTRADPFGDRLGSSGLENHQMPYLWPLTVGSVILFSGLYGAGWGRVSVSQIRSSWSALDHRISLAFLPFSLIVASSSSVLSSLQSLPLHPSLLPSSPLSPPLLPTWTSAFYQETNFFILAPLVYLLLIGTIHPIQHSVMMEMF